MMEPESQQPASERIESIGGYRVESHLASGGMGEIYLARAPEGETVAIKCFRRSQWITEGDQQTRFERERTISASLSHPNIVRILDHGEEDGRQFLVMEYVEGSNLRDVIDESAPIGEERVAQIASTITEAVGHLHDLGIVHRDLKPENVLIGKRGEIKITDFGLASNIDEIGSLTVSGQVLGSADYLAPEQRYRLPMDGRADQYSLAVMVYELMTGQKPMGIFKPPSQVNRDLDKAVDAIVMRGLQRDPDERFSDIREFSSALQAHLQGKTRHRPRRVVAFLVVLVLSLIAIVVWYPREPPEPLNATGRPLTSEEVARLQGDWATHLGRPVLEGNANGILMTVIPPGEFLMGGTTDDIESCPPSYLAYRYGTEMQPRHHVRITYPFLISAHEITVSQFRKFVDASGHVTEAEREFGQASSDEPGERRRLQVWNQPGYAISEDYPVTCVSAADIEEYCRWLSESEGARYRLPTEAEWEYACRAGTQSAWSFGNDFDQASRYSRSMPRDSVSPFPPPLAVGSPREPNAFRVYDMHGNVAEYCIGVFSSEGYTYADERGVFENPLDAPEGEPQADVLRGGGSYAVPWRQRSAIRHSLNRKRLSAVRGFRVVRVLADTDPIADAMEAMSDE